MRIPLRHRVLLVVLALACALTPANPQSGASPWRFPAGVDRAALERQFSPYWWENYESARQILDAKGGADPAKLQEAANRLRLAIAVESQGSAEKQNPRTRSTFPYFPYLKLGIALGRLGQFAEAESCLDRENLRDLQKTDSGVRELAELRNDIESQKANQAYAAMVVKVESWQASKEGIWLTEAGRGRLAKLLADGRSLAAEQQIEGRQRLQQQIAKGVEELLQVEMQPRKDRLEELTSPAWAAAFGNQPLGVESGVCDPPSGATTAPALTAAQQSFETCVATTDDAMRRAGRRGCDHLVDLRRQVNDRADLARQQGGQSTAPPDVPPTCSNTDWNALQAQELWSAVDGLSFPRVRGTFVAVLDSIGQQLAGLLEKLGSELTAARSKIPQISNRCGQGLQLGTAATRLAELKGSIDSAVGSGGVNYSDDLKGIPAEVDQELGRLVERAGRRVGQMIADKDACAGLDTSVLDPLANLEAAFRRTGGSGGTELQALCSAVNTADSKINECWGANTSSIQAKLSSYSWFLEVAGQSAIGQGDGMSCVREQLAAIKKQPKNPGRNTEVWVNGARTAIGGAQACLGDYHTSHGEWVRTVQDQVRGAAGTLEDVEVPPGDGLAAKIEEVKQAFRGSREELDRLAPLLFEQTDQVDEQALRERIDQAGLSGNLAASRWQEFQGVSGAETGEAILAIRNEAIRPVLAEAAATLVRWEPVVGRFVPMQALIEAFAHLERGNLDGAIRSLREARSRGALPSEGKVGALGHASLSYFLYLKGLAAGSGDEVAGLLRDDAAREARQAFQADAGFALPATLFGNTGFRSFFDDCCADIRQ